MKKTKSNLTKDKEKLSNKKSSKKIAFQDSKKESSNNNNNTNKNINKNKKQKNTKNQKSNNIPLKKLDSPEFPEAIADVIINKIISYVISKTNANEVYSHMDEKCFDYLKYLINPFLTAEYLFYEDGIEDLNYQKTKFYYKFPVTQKVNTWAVIQEPESSNIDRYCSSLSKIIPFKTEKNDSNKENIHMDNEDLKNLKQEIKMVRRTSTRVDANLIVNESEEYETIKNLKSIIPTKNQSINLKSNNASKISFEKNKKEEDQKILEMPYVDLPKELYENKYLIINDNEENSKLRKERQSILIKKGELKALKEIEEKKDKLNRFQNKFARNIDGSRLTFDPDGKILNIHPFHQENLINEFCFVKVPNIDTKNLDFNRRRSSSMFNKSMLLKQKSFLDKKKYNFSKKNTLKKIKIDKNKKPKSEDIKEIFKYLRNVLLPKWQRKPIKTLYKDSENENKKRYWSNKKSFREFFWPFLQYYIFKEQIERNPIDKANNRLEYNKYESSRRKIVVPSGSNFSIIKPEIGVVILNKDDDKKKEIKDGGFDYIKKYNKPSMYEFSKLVMETSHLNSKIISSGLIESKINEINEIKKINKKNELNREDYNYNGYMMEFNDNNNPLFQGALSINDKKRNFSSLISTKNNSEIDKDSNSDKYKINIIKGRNILKSTTNEKYSKNKYNSMSSINNMQNSIKLTNNIKVPNLYSIFHDTINIEKNNESINNYNDKDYYFLEKSRNNSALPIIGLRKKEVNENELSIIKNKKEGRRIINKFNYKIIKDRKWGQEDEKKIKEREALNFGLENKSNNNIHSDLNKQIKNSRDNFMIIKDTFSKRNRKAHLFRVSSAQNII